MPIGVFVPALVARCCAVLCAFQEVIRLYILRLIFGVAESNACGCGIGCKFLTMCGRNWRRYAEVPCVGLASVLAVRFRCLLAWLRQRCCQQWVSLCFVCTNL